MKVVGFAKKSLAGQLCLSPFVSLSVGMHGQAGLCGCDQWMPTKIGSLVEHSLADLLKSDLAQDIRRSIINGTYEYCNENTCGIIRNNELNTRDTIPRDVAELLDNPAQFKMPHEITIAGDYTCNLSCPSCRSQVRKVPPHEFQRQREIGRALALNLFSVPTEQQINITLSTTGELFASPSLLEFVSTIDLNSFPNVKLLVQTNGLLCRSRWHRLGPAESAVDKVTITVDAARAETYEVVRRGGRWPDLLDAMEFLAEKKQQTGIKLYTRMVVQKLNYQEMQEFYNFSLKYSADRVEFVRLRDWGPMGKLFAENDVLDPVHPEYTQAKAQLDLVLGLPQAWFAGGI